MEMKECYRIHGRHGNRNRSGRVNHETHGGTRKEDHMAKGRLDLVSAGESVRSSTPCPPCLCGSNHSDFRAFRVFRGQTVLRLNEVGSFRVLRAFRG